MQTYVGHQMLSTAGMELCTYQKFRIWLRTVAKIGLILSHHMINPPASYDLSSLSPPNCSCMSYIMSYIMSSCRTSSLPQKSSPALFGTMKSFIFSNHPFFFALPFFLLVPNLDANHPLSLTLLHHPLTVLTPNSFQSSFNLVPHLLFPSSTSRTILFHERSSSPLLAR